MDNALTTALLITVIGMTLLFGSLLLFYGLLSLLTATVKDRPSTTAQSTEEKEGARQHEMSLRAAAIAIALARAEAEQRSGPPAVSGEVQSPSGIVSPWWTLHHQRQLTPHQGTRRNP